ncbi:hypothetical protein, partial [Methanobrevibacter arboriphilus]|uniref:hypothetical protein n=1 Tax=Methanobrevibacter arboriphilus TaxID=39441 RepID=UPI000AA1127F
TNNTNKTNSTNGNGNKTSDNPVAIATMKKNRNTNNSYYTSIDKYIWNQLKKKTIIKNFFF